MLSEPWSFSSSTGLNLTRDSRARAGANRALWRKTTSCSSLWTGSSTSFKVSSSALCLVRICLNTDWTVQCVGQEGCNEFGTVYNEEEKGFAKGQLRAGLENHKRKSGTILCFCQWLHSLTYCLKDDCSPENGDKNISM